MRLSPEQLRNTISAALNGRPAPGKAPAPLPAGLVVGLSPVSGSRYSSYAGANSLNDTEVRESFQSSAAIATALVAKVKAASATCNADCAGAVLASKGEILFNRPLAADELGRYKTIFTANVGTLGADEALGLALQAQLMAPQTLFRSELGTNGKLTAFEIAAAIAYTLTDAPADEELWNAARSGQLDGAEIKRQVERILQAVPTLPPMRRFVQEYFEYEGVTAVFKSRSGYDAEALLHQTDAMVSDILATNARKDLLKTLLTSDVSFVSNATAALYGAPAPGKAGLQRVTLPPTERMGLLTQPAFLAAFSEMDHSLPVRRGRFVNEKLLCRPVPDAPIGTIPPLPDLGPNATMKDRLAQHRREPSCAVCHVMLDPPGLAFEMWDDAGKRSAKMVDTSGELTGTIDQDGPFKDGLEMIGRLAKSAAAEQCFATNSFRFWLGRDDRADEACVVGEAQAAYASGGGDYVALLQALFTSNVFLTRS